MRIARPDGALEAPVVVLCDGTLSLLAKEAGLHQGFRPEQLALGVRALYRLTEENIDERFGLVGRQGATQEFLGCTEGIRGGGFVYTQTETLAAGLVLHLDSLKQRGLPPYDLLDRFVASPYVAPLLRGARLVEYSAHLLPEGGLKMVPRLSVRACWWLGMRPRSATPTALAGGDEPGHDVGPDRGGGGGRRRRRGRFLGGGPRGL